MSVMTDRGWAQDSLILNKTKCTHLSISCFVATRVKSHFSHHLAKSSGLIYFAIFENTHDRLGNNLSVV